MPRLSVPQMVEAAKRFGLQVEVVPGAETRGSASFDPAVFVGHHTAGAKTGARPSLNLCVNGRSDLAGPLCNWFLDRNGVAVIVAAGVANHAGAGGFRGFSGNSRAMGCEAESTGLGANGDWTGAQLSAYPRVVAAGLWLMNRDASWYCSHRTWAPTRKIDPTGIDDVWMRRQVATLLQSPPSQGDDVSYDDAARALRDVLKLPTTGLAVPPGQKNNGNLYVNLLGGAQQNVNNVNALRALMTQTLDKADKTLEAIKANTAVTGDDEAVLTKYISDLRGDVKHVDEQLGKIVEAAEELAANSPEVTR